MTTNCFAGRLPSPICLTYVTNIASTEQKIYTNISNAKFTYQFLAGLHVSLGAGYDGLNHCASFVGKKVNFVDDQQRHQRAQ